MKPTKAVHTFCYASSHGIHPAIFLQFNAKLHQFSENHIRFVYSIFNFFYQNKYNIHTIVHLL